MDTLNLSDTSKIELPVSVTPKPNPPIADTLFAGSIQLENAVSPISKPITSASVAISESPTLPVSTTAESTVNNSTLPSPEVATTVTGSATTSSAIIGSATTDAAAIDAAVIDAEAVDPTIPGFSSYRTVEATYTALEKLAADNSDIAKWVDIGDSYDKVTPDGAPGYDIFALQLGKASATPKPVLFLQGAIHGEDYASTEVATRFAESLVARYGIDPETTWLLNYFDVRIVPIVNPDGRKLAEQGTPWRKNTNPNSMTTPVKDVEGSVKGVEGTIEKEKGLVEAISTALPNAGVDLDRNFDVQWGKVTGGASTDPAAPTYQGTAAFSEPETQALRDYLLNSFVPRSTDSAPSPKPTGVFIDLQSSGEQILYPDHWTKQTAPDYQGLRNLGLKLGYFAKGDGTGYDVRQASQKEIASGTAIDWVYQTFGVASYKIAIGSQPFEASSTFEATTIPKLLPALTYALKSAYSPYRSTLAPDIQSVSLSSGQVISGLATSVALTVVVDSSRYADSNRSSQPNAEGTSIPTPVFAAGARYSIDAPSWVPDTQLYDMNLAEGDYDSPIETAVATINASALTPGRHTIFVEGLDANGVYGAPTAVFLDVLQPPENATISRGSSADDVLTPVNNANTVALGREGNDRIQTANGKDLILAGIGNDIVSAGEQDDLLYGGAGDDQLTGGAGNDQIYGEAGNDQLVGEDGDDILWGGAGQDSLTGGSGVDTFALVYTEPGNTILDFAPNEDRLGLAGTLRFSQLSIVQSGENALIQIGQTVLATLTGVQATALSESSFVRLSVA